MNIMATTPSSSSPSASGLEGLSQRLGQVSLYTQGAIALPSIHDHLSVDDSPISTIYSPNSNATSDVLMHSRLHTHWKVPPSTDLNEPLKPLVYPSFIFIIEQRLKSARKARAGERVVARRKRVTMGNKIWKRMNASLRPKFSRLGRKTKYPYDPYIHFLSTSTTSHPMSFPYPSSPQGSLYSGASAPGLSDSSSRCSSPAPSDPYSDEDAGEYFYPPPCVYVDSPSPFVGPASDSKAASLYDWDPEIEGDMLLPPENLKLYRRWDAIERNESFVKKVRGGVENEVSPWAWQWEN
ncbi:hypothetical protein E1B28_002205 [Marasmius oreades]|uniref:Uncharacterized protein n=1 Tax=Marasmius oreades TaxID=181124 RepID=A0A9P7RM70_9AGAR|nr:uncharacterized protein E1B28_002205 [Marasmius oreades]KAG7086234.1 hypothetical protein E1B28_002205 [Marasmius oreades]